MSLDASWLELFRLRAGKLPDAELPFGWKSAEWLLDPSPNSALNRFLDFGASRLLTHLSRRRCLPLVRTRERVRGKVRWPATVAAQQTDSSVYLCAEVEYRYNTLENQAFCYALEELVRLERAVPDFLRQGRCYHLDPSVASIDAQERLDWIVRTLARLQAHKRLSRIDSRFGPDHRDRLRASRINEYRMVYKLLRELRTPAKVSSQFLLLPSDLGKNSRRWLAHLAHKKKAWNA